jgi:type II secretory pathway component GspD/PulD (secretin)
VEKEMTYIADYDFEDITSPGLDQPFRVIADPQPNVTYGGVVLNVTPTITADKKYVLLRITTSFTQVEIEDFPIPSGVGEQTFPIQLPTLEVAEVLTRVSVPDGGTLLIGGQKISGESEKQQGVPILSKIPLIGRLFENRSKSKDEKVLLILVKPTIIIQSEREERAVATMEKGF